MSIAYGWKGCSADSAGNARAIDSQATLGRFGWQRVPVPKDKSRESIGNVFAPQKKDTAQAATLTGYYDALGKVKSIDDIKNGILKNEVDFDEHDFSKI